MKKAKQSQAAYFHTAIRNDWFGLEYVVFYGSEVKLIGFPLRD